MTPRGIRYEDKGICWVCVPTEEHESFLKGVSCDEMWVVANNTAIVVKRRGERYLWELFVKKDGVLGRIAYMLSDIGEGFKGALCGRLRRWQGFEEEPDPFVVEHDFQECKWGPEGKTLLPFKDTL